MATVYDPIKDNREQSLSLFGNGLDESDVLLFINSLIEQNSELAGKLEQAESLIELVINSASDASQQLESARAEADRIIAEARLLAEKTTHEQVSAAEEQAQTILKAARERAEAILRSAQDEASRIIFEAKQKVEAARRQAEQIVNAAEAEARNRTTEISQASSEIQSKAAGGKGNQSAPISSKERTDEEERCALYSGTVEVEIPPPLAIGPLTNLAKYLKNTRQIDVLALNSTPNHGLKIKLFLHNPLPLVNILKSMPQVEKVAGEFRKNQGVPPSRSQPGNRSILVKMRN